MLLKKVNGDFFGFTAEKTLFSCMPHAAYLIVLFNGGYCIHLLQGSFYTDVMLYKTSKRYYLGFCKSMLDRFEMFFFCFILR